jgi:hypothetical protein
MSPAKPRLRVVVDGSNFATEGRTIPSLTQLDEAVRSFLEENPSAEVIVVADASFEHRVATSERARFKEAELAGEIVTPPAGAVGRGDAFILKIADRINGVVLSNDSFQEFHDQYPWLFDIGRLIGGKPVPGVGWVFTPRQPVRGIKSGRAAKKLSVALPGGVPPTIGTTLTPVKGAKSPVKPPAKVAKVAKAPAKATKKASKSSAEVAKKAPAKAPPVKKVAKKEAIKATAKAAKKTAKALAKSLVKAAPAAATPAMAPAVAAPTVALRRGRQPVNPESEFALFRATHRLGSRVDGEVTTFTSHGAVIDVVLKNGQHVECYAPTTLLGTPPPARARDVLKRGDRKTFRLVTVDPERRIAELALT